LPKKTKMPRIDAVRRCISDFNLKDLKDIHTGIVEITIKNKIFRNGAINGLKVVFIDGVKLFESTKKCCDKCLTHIDKNGITHYFHRAVVCSTVGSYPHIILDKKCLNQRKDGSNKDEGELTGGKKLIKSYTSNIIILQIL
jgi:hypothetical protein